MSLTSWSSHILRYVSNFSCLSFINQSLKDRKKRTMHGRQASNPSTLGDRAGKSGDEGHCWLYNVPGKNESSSRMKVTYEILKN